MVKLGNIELNGLVYNAAGPRCITEEELIDIDNSTGLAKNITSIQET